MGSDSCANNADCLDTEDSYMCTCSIGFTGDGLISCDSELLITTFISECVCTYICLLNLLILSSDIDECAEGTHMCDPLAFCIDTEGSYTCICNDGYTGNGETCSGN